MVIRPSASGTVRQLIAALVQPEPVRREAAVARLRVVGTRAVPSLIALLQQQDDPAVREAALRVLEGLDDPRAADAALRALQDRDAGVRVAAITVLRPRLVDEMTTRVLDALSSIAVDAQESRRVREAAIDALRQLPPAIVQPIVETAQLEPGPPDPGDPSAVQEWVSAHPDAPLSALHDLIAGVRQRETAERDEARRARWQAARGAVHAALARRGSRVALYDLRETFERAGAPLTLDYLTAAAGVGDTTLLDALAAAWRAAPASEVWWREHLADAAAAIAKRLQLTRRHAAIKRLHARWPGFLR